jgi:FkbM family methyltransferase
MILKRIKDTISRIKRDDPKQEIFMNEDIDLKLLDLYKYFVKPGNLCFDIGANVGARTDILLELEAKVICVEPQRECIQTLNTKYKNNHKVKILGVGVASTSGTMSLFICRAANTISTFSERWKTGRFHSYVWDEQYDVPVITLDEMVGEYGVPDFCKIDVEGFELDVLKGLSTPVRYLSFEFTREFIGDAQKCVEHLESLGPVNFNFALGDNLRVNPSLAFNEWCDGKSLFKELNLILSPLLWGDIYAHFTN